MRNWLRRFATVGVLVTAADLAMVALLRFGLRLPVAVADGVAVAAASGLSYGLHRTITFGDDPQVRWVHEPNAFVLVALAAGAVDLAVVTAGTALRGDDPDRGDRCGDGLGDGPVPLLGWKVLALALAASVRLQGYRRQLFRGVRRDQGRPAAGEQPQGDVRLSVVVPAYGEASRIAETVTRLRTALAGLADQGGLEIVVVDDGSPDDTAAEARRAGADVVLSLSANRGKGAAVRAGMLAARGRTRAFTDADLAYGPEQLLRLLAATESGWDMVVGSRRHVETATLVRARRVREVSGRLFNLLTSLVLLGHYRDTQCGLKAFRSDAAELLFGRARLDGFAFDVELFHLAERYRLSLTEVPVAVTNSTTSTVRVVAAGWAMLRDLLRMRRWAGRGAYDNASSSAQERLATPVAGRSAR